MKTIANRNPMTAAIVAAVAGAALVALVALQLGGRGPRTVTFTAVQTASTQTRKDASLTNVNYDGTTKIGHSTTTCTTRTSPPQCTSAITLAAGIVNAHWTVNRSATHHGSIAGGTGSYAGATGTITITLLNQAATKAKVTLHLR